MVRLQSEPLILIERFYEEKDAQLNTVDRYIISVVKRVPQDGCSEILQIHKREVSLPQRDDQGISGI